MSPQWSPRLQFSSSWLNILNVIYQRVTFCTCNMCAIIYISSFVSECFSQSQSKNNLSNLSPIFQYERPCSHTLKHTFKPDLHLFVCPCSELQPEPWGVPRLPEWEGVRRGGVAPGLSAGGGGDCYRSGPLPLLHHHHRWQLAQRQSTPKPAPPS